MKYTATFFAPINILPQQGECGHKWGIRPVNFVQGRGHFEQELRFEMAEAVEFEIY